MEKLIVGNTIIEYELVKSTRAKKLRITVNKDKVKVSMPNGMTKSEAKAFVELKKEWILKHLENFQGIRDREIKKEYTDGESFLYRGQAYVLRTIIINSPKVSLEVNDNNIWLYLPESLSREEWPKKIKEVLIAWYKQEAKLLFIEKLDHYSNIMGIKYNQLRIKNQKTRWGSCSSKGNINLNWRVIMAPDEVIDYLIVHELAHLKHMDHSEEYWNFVSQYISNYKELRKWLIDNGVNLIV